MPVLGDQMLSHNCRGVWELTAGSWLSLLPEIASTSAVREKTLAGLLTAPFHFPPENNVCVLTLVH